MRSAKPHSDWASFSRPPSLAGIELYSARFTHHTYGLHAHDTLAIGFVESGIGEFLCHGRNHRAGPGSLVLIEPGEAHTGGVPRRRRRSDASAAEPLVYRMLYLDNELIRSLTGWSAVSLQFADAAPANPAIARRLRCVYDALASPGEPLLGETALCELLLDPVPLGACTPRRGASCASPSASRMTRAREYLDAHVTRGVSLRELAAVVDLHPAYLVRAFHASTGFPPHAYQLQRRLSLAKGLLASGTAIPVAAIEAGFVDQSHLTRHFRRALGVTPGRYQRAVAGQAAARTRSTA